MRASRTRPVPLKRVRAGRVRVAALLASGVVVAVIGACSAQQDLGTRSRGSLGEAGLPTDDAGTSTRDSAPLPAVDTGRSYRIVFVTVNTYLGDLRSEGGGGATTGLEGADRICNREAAGNGIAGNFRAWLSTKDTNAKDRIDPVGPWKLVDETVIFPGAAVQGAPQRYIQLDASGERIFVSNDSEVWTATKADGTTNIGGTCDDWTSASSEQSAYTGSTVGMGGDWTDYGLSGTAVRCSARCRLFCFEQ